VKLLARVRRVLADLLVLGVLKVALSVFDTAVQTLVLNMTGHRLHTTHILTFPCSPWGSTICGTHCIQCKRDTAEDVFRGVHVMCHDGNGSQQACN